MAKPGDLVLLNFPGAAGVKRRPAAVLSSDLYHLHRPDIIVGLVTSNVAVATALTDYVLQDWLAAGLRGPSVFRAYFAMTLPSNARMIGRLSPRDWDEVRQRVRL